jgi:D-alanyl-D-alanine carboxypeptidase
VMAACSGAGRVLRQGFIAFLAAAVLTVVFADHAEARRRKHHKAHGRGSHAVGRIHSPIYSAIIVDAKTGKILHAEDPDGVRHPASITKVMTLYMLFEQMEAGRLTLATPLEVSDEAAAKPPTKLGLRPGSTITVEDAIKGVITKSANDAAAVIAENLGGDEERFAAAMTRKARALGMKNTVYRNASGLPDAEQVTTRVIWPFSAGPYRSASPAITAFSAPEASPSMAARCVDTIA